ncbi:hypothetical protein [Paraburkholderia sp. MM5384-R2]|uniref:hypothetical protein n=1 Tax=Paraburkholderia sp. MM5384-R2 TaxID=2723097 RepID=UPI00161F3C45|nr:hypothetical protein [Paraburkholderia sp. MM5384-R2]MBB5501051.1 hypothetical protein [Paraburkholderia sp. MM5384-R2]
MHETKFIHLPHPGPVTKCLGVAAGITAISFAAAWAFEQHRSREEIRVLAAMPGAASIFPALRAHSEMALSQFGVGLPLESDNHRP